MKNKPRDFWIDNIWTSLDSNPPFISAHAYTEARDNCTHVIEYSAVEALQKENEELKTLLLKKDERIKLQLVGTDCINEGVSKLNAEITSLRALLKEAVEALEWIKNPDHFDKSCMPIVNATLAKLKAKHGDL